MEGEINVSIDRVIATLEKLEELIVDEYPLKYTVALQEAVHWLVRYADDEYREV